MLEMKVDENDCLDETRKGAESDAGRQAVWWCQRWFVFVSTHVIQPDLPSSPYFLLRTLC